MTIGDIAAALVPEHFRLAYLVFDTIGNPTSQDDQVAYFTNAGRHLEPLQAVSSLRSGRLRCGGSSGGDDIAFDVTPDRLGFDTFDVARQRGCRTPTGSVAGRGGDVLLALPLCLAAELDLMARISGMRCVERWSGWNRTPFPGENASHCRCRRSRRTAQADRSCRTALVVGAGRNRSQAEAATARG